MAWGQPPKGRDIWRIAAQAQQAKALGVPVEALAAAQAPAPYVTPTEAPVGSYDPAYDAQIENANQGWAWAAQDYDTSKARIGNDFDLAQQYMGEDRSSALGDLLTQRVRSQDDYQSAAKYLGEDRQNALGDLTTQRTRGQEDYDQSYGRLSTDYGTTKGRARDDFLTNTGRVGEDYATATGDLNRNYTNLGVQQGEGARAAGVAGGGALAQAMMKRQANQARDQGRIDQSRDRTMQDMSTGFNRGNADLDLGYGRQSADMGQGLARFLQDNSTATGRTNQGYDRQSEQMGTAFNRNMDDNTLATGRTTQAYDRQGNALSTQFQRGNIDLDTNFTRGGITNANYNQQMGDQKLYLAAAAGGLPTPPATTAGKVEVYNGKRYTRLPSGELVPAPASAPAAEGPGTRYASSSWVPQNNWYLNG